MTPTLLGFPLWTGLKKRVAKKYLKYYWRYKSFDELLSYAKSLGTPVWPDYAAQADGAHANIMLNTCNGLNSWLVAASAEYVSVKSGQILYDIRIVTGDNNCSVRHCGIEPALPVETIKKRIEIYKSPEFAPGWDFDLKYHPEVFSLRDDGTADINWERYKELLGERKKSKAGVARDKSC